MNEVINDKGKIVKAAVQKQIKEIKDDEESADELKILDQYSKLLPPMYSRRMEVVGTSSLGTTRK